MTEQPPLTRRQLRELERQKELSAQSAADEPAAVDATSGVAPEAAPAPTAEPAPASRPTPVSAATPAPEPAPASGPPRLTRRELREQAQARAMKQADAVETTAERAITRRPVREPTTTSSIPAYGSLHVPLDEEGASPAVGSPPSAPEWEDEATQVSQEAVPGAVAEEAASPAEAPAHGAHDDAEQATPERVSIFGPPAGSMAAATPAPTEAVPVPEPEVTPEPVASPPRATEARGVSDARPAVQPEWRDLMSASSPAVSEPPAAEEEAPRGSVLGTVLRFLALAVAFFIIGVLIWIFASNQMGGDSGDGGTEPTTQAHGPVVRGDV